MERARVFIRLCNNNKIEDHLSFDDNNNINNPNLHESEETEDGICRTSDTTVRLEHSEMSPGVASITFDQVFDENFSNPMEMYQKTWKEGIERIIQGHQVTFLNAGAEKIGKSILFHGLTTLSSSSPLPLQKKKNQGH
jgi:hypothetical protein